MKAPLLPRRHSANTEEERHATITTAGATLLLSFLTHPSKSSLAPHSSWCRAGLYCTAVSRRASAARSLHRLHSITREQSTGLPVRLSISHTTDQIASSLKRFLLAALFLFGGSHHSKAEDCQIGSLQPNLSILNLLSSVTNGTTAVGLARRPAPVDREARPRPQCVPRAH